MKRSEVIKVIRAELVRLEGANLTVIADEILNRIEECGLKPPIKKRCSILLRDEFFWEKENG